MWNEIWEQSYRHNFMKPALPSPSALLYLRILHTSSFWLERDCQNDVGSDSSINWISSHDKTSSSHQFPLWLPTSKLTSMQMIFQLPSVLRPYSLHYTMTALRLHCDASWGVSGCCLYTLQNLLCNMFDSNIDLIPMSSLSYLFIQSMYWWICSTQGLTYIPRFRISMSVLCVFGVGGYGHWFQKQ